MLNQINMSEVGKKPGTPQPNVSGPAMSPNFSAPPAGGAGFVAPQQQAGAVSIPVPPPNRPMSTPEVTMMQALMRRLNA